MTAWFDCTWDAEYGWTWSVITWPGCCAIYCGCTIVWTCGWDTTYCCWDVVTYCAGCRGRAYWQFDCIEVVYVVVDDKLVDIKQIVDW